MRSVLTKTLRIIKRTLKRLPIDFTQNQRYDAQTVAIIKKVCKKDSNCIDVGTHSGEILDHFLKAAPAGIHFGFEPIPLFYKTLERKYASRPNVKLYECALSDSAGTAEFNYVSTNPAYSGLKKRTYDRKGELDEKIVVRTALLDEVVLPLDMPIHLIKIDVEGGELAVLQGARKLVEKYKPVIIFEAGIGGSDLYGTTPESLYTYFASFNYRISLMADYLKHLPALSAEGFKTQFINRLNYYFVAHI
ncbi:MAG: methyltransferase FkbM family [Flaviaesturariibacter sp.]|nr:methyltransferase FkbM family [Flaviaesturariibacter sp.]